MTRAITLRCQPRTEPSQRTYLRLSGGSVAEQELLTMLTHCRDLWFYATSLPLNTAAAFADSSFRSSNFPSEQQTDVFSLLLRSHL